MTFTDVLIQAVTRELTARRKELDHSKDVKKVNLTIYVNRGTNQPRSVVYFAERETHYEDQRRMRP
jgi:hypothetical protein